MGPGSWLIAFLGGVVSFVSPCMWPMYPAYLTYLSGGGPAGPGREWAPPGRWLMLGRACLFLLGFGLVFIALGATASALGQILTTYQVAFRKVSGLLIIGFGLAMAGVLPYWVLGTERRLGYHPVRPSGLGAVGLGAAFAFGWTPCVGPVLASILLLTSASANLGTGVVLLSVYTVGFAVPFLLVAGSLGQARGLMRRMSPAVPWVTRISGGLLAVLGVLVFTNYMSVIAWALYSRIQIR